MKPYKKRLIFNQMQLQNGTDTDNSDDSDTLGNSPPTAENLEKDKERAEGKASRKKWKRKISRKQFRHHDIKIFAPTEYRSSPLLKQKDPLTASPKIPESSKESITETILASLGGIPTQVKPAVTEKDGGAEENNNTNEFQNHNNGVGKHQLPAIIIETPAVRRRSVDNSNPTKQLPFANSKPAHSGEIFSHHPHEVSNSKSATVQPLSNMMMDLDLDYQNGSKNRPTTNHNQTLSGGAKNGHHHTDLPENLSLKRRYSVEVPVDLRKKTHNDTYKGRRPTSEEQIFKNGGKMICEENNRQELLFEAIKSQEIIENYLFTLVNSTNSQKTPSDRTHYHKKLLRDFEEDRLIKMVRLANMTQNLQQLQKENFSFDILTKMAQVYREVEIALADDSIYQEVRLEFSKICKGIYEYMYGKTHGLMGLRCDPAEFIKSLGSFEGQEIDHPQPPSLEQIQRLRNLNLNDAHPVENTPHQKFPPYRYYPPSNTNIQPPPAVYPQSPPARAEPDFRRQIDLGQSNNEKNMVYPSYPAIKGIPKTPEDARFLPPLIPIPANMLQQPHIRHNVAVNGNKELGAVKRPRSKSQRTLHGAGQSHDLKRSMSNPHNANLEYSTLTGAHPNMNTYRVDVSTTRASDFQRREPNPEQAPPPILGYSHQDLKLYQNSYPLEYHASHHHVVNGTLMDSQKKVLPPNDRLLPKNPVQTFPLKSNNIEPSAIKEVPYIHPEVLERNIVKPKERPKTMPEVFVADGSMQITKEPSKLHSRHFSDTAVDSVRMTVITNSTETVSRAASPSKKVTEDETNPEFRDWLEKLKKNEKLKSKFLSQMGIKPPSTVSDCIEISDDDDDVKVKIDLDQEPTIKVPPEFQRSSSLEITPVPLPNARIDAVKPPVKSPPQLKPSLSKSNYVPPISLACPQSSSIYPNIPNQTAQVKTIYSPEIEPISPVSNTSFKFPPTGPKISPQILPKTLPIDQEVVIRDRVTSPTYAAKRKTPQNFPDEYPRSDSTISRKSSEYSPDNAPKRRKSLDRPQTSMSPRVAPSGKLCYIRENHIFLRYFEDTQMEMFISNLSSQDEELLRTTGIDPEKIKSTYRSSDFHMGQLGKTEVVHLPPHVEFSTKEDLPDVEEFVKESDLVVKFVPKDFADFYRYVTGFQIIKNKHPVSLKTFLTMYNTNRTEELLRKYLHRLD